MSEQVIEAMRRAIAARLPEAEIDVAGGAGHYTVTVVCASFEGKGMVECHRLVYEALAPLMSGPEAPVHAIDRLHTSTP